MEAGRKDDGKGGKTETGRQARLRQRKVRASGAWGLRWEAALCVALNDACMPMFLPACRSPCRAADHLPALLIPLPPCRCPSLPVGLPAVLLIPCPPC